MLLCCIQARCMQDVTGKCEPTAMPNATSKMYTSETDTIWSHCLQRQGVEYLGADTHGKLSDLPDSVFAVLPLHVVHRLTSLMHQIDNLAQL